MGKRVTLLLIIMLAASSLIMTESAFAQSFPKPSVPEFTVKFVDRSYDVPTTYSTDPYTGENVTHPSEHVSRVTLEMTIKNQPFVPYYDAGSGWDISFYYNIRMKAHYVNDWTELYRPSDGYPTQSDGEYTVISLGTVGENGLHLETNAKTFDVPSDGIVDFQVEAMIGYVSRGYNADATGPFDTYPWEFTGEKGGWSNTQTITAPTSTSPPPTSPTPTPNPAPTPIQVPGQSAFSIESNSTITELFFNSTSSELTFTVNGIHGTAGYVKVTIAKSLVSSIQNIKAYLDGEQLAVSITSNGDFWLLTFTYMHSTHQVRISLAQNAAATPLLGIENWIWIAAVVIAVVGAGLLVYFRKRRK